MERSRLKEALSVNRLAWKLVDKIREKPEYYGVIVEQTSSGSIVVDAGIEGEGGFETGRVITEICMGGCGKAEVAYKEYGKLSLPSIFIQTDHPALAALGSQFAGWRIKEGNYFAIGSGPGRALALKPREIYEQIEYRDSFERAVVVLETDKHPPTKLLERLAKECQVSLKNLAVILTPTASVAGSTQVSGRVVETGIHKLKRLGLDPKLISSAWGSAPIPPIHPKFTQAMARTNDAILYGGIAYYAVQHDDEEALKEMAHKAPSKASRAHGRAFIEIFKEANYDFYKIDPNLFAPAIVIVNNVKTGSVFKAGEIEVEALTESFGFKTLS